MKNECQHQNPNTPQSENVQACATCKFLGVLKGTLSNYSHCRRHAPVLTEGSTLIGDCWPTVNLADWCGDWVALTADEQRKDG